MPRPKEGYKLADGTPVPGVNQVSSKFQESFGLQWWAFEMGKSGQYATLREAQQDAKGIGTVIHSMCDKACKGRPFEEIMREIETFPTETMRDAARRSFEAFENWREQFGFTLYRQEISLVSERHRYGGTLDLVMMTSTGLALLDFKTCKDQKAKPYREYVLQLAAYKALWDENFPNDRLTGGFHLIMLPKDGSRFKHHHWPQLSKAWSAFLLLRQAYDLALELENPAYLAGIPLSERSSRQVITAPSSGALIAAVAPQPKPSPWASVPAE